MNAFFYYEGIVHHNYALEGQTINIEYNLQTMRRKRQQLWASGNWRNFTTIMPQHMHPTSHSNFWQHMVW